MIDVVIATYNRHRKVCLLIDQLLPFCVEGGLGLIIVIDSSDQCLDGTVYDPAIVKIVHSTHKNQPYQRLLGTKVSRADFILFLDDDMEVIDDSFCKDLSNIDRDVAGINLLFKNSNKFLGDLNPSILGRSAVMNFFRTLSGYPAIAANKYWLAGIRGRRVNNEAIEYLSGGAFVARRDEIFKGVSFTLLDLFEKKMAMGEDMILGFALSRRGSVRAWDKVYFNHNDQGDSTYTAGNHYSFNKKVAYSRLFLSFEYARLGDVNYALAWLHFLWFSLWRIAGLGVNTLLKPSKIKINGLRGYMKGTFLAILELTPLYFLGNEDKRRAYWQNECELNVSAKS